MKQKSPDRDNKRKPSVRKIRIDEEHDGQRVDNFLRRELPGVPKGRLYRLIRRGEVRVNGGRVRAEYRLRENDELRIPPVRIAEGGPLPPDRLAAAMIDHVNGDHSSGISSSSLAAISGYASITIPAGEVLGLPIGISFIGGAFSDAKLIRFAYALEQAGYTRQPPSLDMGPK